MARAIGLGSGKWFGSPAIGRIIVGHGFTAITSAGNIAGIGIAIMTIGMTTIGVMTIVATIATNPGERAD